MLLKQHVRIYYRGAIGFAIWFFAGFINILTGLWVRTDFGLDGNAGLYLIIPILGWILFGLIINIAIFDTDMKEKTTEKIEL